MRTHTALAVLLVLAAAVFHLPAIAGADAQAHLRLRVIDQTGYPLPSATVTIFTLDGNPGVTATTDEAGSVAFPNLPVGIAQVRVEFPGFSPYNEKAELGRGDNAQTVALKLAGFREEVTVRATPGAPAGS